MPIIADDREMNMALQLAARSPFEGADPGFIERFKADYESTRLFSRSVSDGIARQDAANEFMTEFYKASGQRLSEWIPPNEPMPMEVESYARKRDRAKEQFETWKRDNPQSSLSFPEDADIRQRADALTIDARRNAADLERRSTSMLSGVGGFAGTAASAMADPVNVMSLGFGASASAGIIRTALTEGAIGIASEAMIQGATLDRKQHLDPSFGLDDALYEVAAAGAGGAVLGGSIKGLADVWQRAKTGKWPSHVKDAGNVMMQEAAVPAGRFEQNMKGETAHRAAITKSLDDLARGRPVELPPEAFAEANARPGRVYDADGNSVGVRYEVVEAGDLITSHTADLGVNPAFPQELQPRDRSRALSQDQIAGIAANLQPERLGFSADAANGAPIVGPDGLVESGNGRVLALRRAMETGGIPADNYRNYLRSQNFDIDGFRNPVLIARRVTDLEDRVAFVTAANRSTAMRLGAAEQALSDARLLDSGLIDTLRGPDITSADNQAFTRGFMGKLPRAEQGNLIDKDGFLSQEGQRRITSALMGRAYGEPVLLGRALEDTDNNIKSIAGAMADSSGPWSKMRDAVARGEIPAGMDITSDLMNAVRLVMKARDEGRSVKDLVNQAEMFGGPDELSKIVARSMFSDADLKRPIGRAKLAAFLDDFATEAMKNDAGPRLFGDALTAPDILKGSLERVGRNDLMRVADERLTPEAIEKLAASPETDDVSIMDARRLIADVEERQLGPIEGAFGKEVSGDVAAYQGPVTIRHGFSSDQAPVFASDFAGDRYDGNSFGNEGVYLDNTGVWTSENAGSRFQPTNVSTGTVDFKKALVISPETMPALTKRIPKPDRQELGENAGLYVGDDFVKFAKSNGYDGIIVQGFDAKNPSYEAEQAMVKQFGAHESVMQDQVFAFNPEAVELDEGSYKLGDKNTPSLPGPVAVARSVEAPKPEPIMVDLGDGRGERSLQEILDEADDEIAAASEIESCTIGAEPAQ